MKLSLCVALLFVAQAMGSAIPQKAVPFHPIGDWTRMLGKSDGVLRKDDKIINGNEAEPHSLPYAVALFMNSGSFCTGSLISNQWVLTAAHCQAGILITYTDVILGAHRVTALVNDGTTIRASEKHVHPDWDRLRLVGDLSLIKLDSAATLNANIQPIRLVDPETTDNFVGSKVRIAGWGKTRDSDGGISNVLRVAETVVITNAECEAVFTGAVHDTTICTAGGGAPGGASGTCNGDSGGAMTVAIGTGNEHQQIGITSFGGNSCEGGLPNGFTRVSSYRGWITETSGV